MDICRIYADFCMYAVAFLLSFLIFVCELNFAEYMRRPIINEKLPISESNPIKARHYDYDRFTYPWHFHSQYEIIYVKESHGLCFVGDCIEKFSAGDVILFGTICPITCGAMIFMVRRTPLHACKGLSFSLSRILCSIPLIIILSFCKSKCCWRNRREVSSFRNRMQPE